MKLLLIIKLMIITRREQEEQYKQWLLFTSLNHYSRSTPTYLREVYFYLLRSCCSLLFVAITEYLRLYWVMYKEKGFIFSDSPRDWEVWKHGARIWLTSGGVFVLLQLMAESRSARGNMWKREKGTKLPWQLTHFCTKGINPSMRALCPWPKHFSLCSTFQQWHTEILRSKTTNFWETHLNHSMFQTSGHPWLLSLLNITFGP
jgi:hypothetical protein